MASFKEGPIKRLAKKLGLAKTTVGGRPYASCWACGNGRCNSGVKDNSCQCCRAGHSGVK